MTASQRNSLGFFVLLALGAAAMAAIYLQSVGQPRPQGSEEPAPEDPRVVFDTPFRNVRPGVEYVGDVVCATCHAAIHRSYQTHSMAHSAEFVLGHSDLERFDNNARTQFAASPQVSYRVERLDDGRLRQIEEIRDGQQQILGEVAVEPLVAVGSGHMGRSYLALRGGSLWQTAFSWYPTAKFWDLSPGFKPGYHARRAVVEDCLFCHVDRVEAVAGTLNQFADLASTAQLSIGCERCHGPGKLHADERGRGTSREEMDTSIVNPKHLRPELQDSICQQCHLQGAERIVRRGRRPFEYRPGLPLEQYYSVFIQPPGRTTHLKTVGHVEDTLSSRCATGSDGQLRCTSCHDPHFAPDDAAKADFYRARCLNCHESQPCGLPLPQRQDRGDDCVACHMPSTASADVVHAPVTDHRILRRPAEGGPSLESRGRPPEPLVLFHAGSPFAPPPAEQQRDLGIALSKAADSRREFVPLAVSYLKAATAAHPSDVAAWDALALAQLAEGDRVAALQAAERALALQPKRESALAVAVSCSLYLQERAAARSYGKQLMEISPGNWDHRVQYGLALELSGDLAEAQSVFQAVIAECPAHALGRAGLAVCLHRQGNTQAAQQQLDLIDAVAADRGAALRRWFGERTR